MGAVRRSWQYCKYRLLKCRQDRKLQVLLVLLLILIVQYTDGIRKMMELTGVSITPYFLPFFLSDYVIALGILKVYILLTAAFIFCDAAKMNEEKYYFIIRTGRKGWMAGDVLYLAMMSIGYAVFIFACSIGAFLPRVVFEHDWGKLIGTLAYTDAIQQYGEMFIISDRVIELYQPVPAVSVTLLLLLLGIFFLGLLIYTVNLLTGTKAAGICSACILIFLCPLISFMNFQLPYWLSPMTWMSIGSLAPVKNQGYPGVLYGIGMYLLLIGGLLLILKRHCKKIQIGA